MQTDGVQRSFILAASKTNRTIFAGYSRLFAIFGPGFGKGNVFTFFPQITRPRPRFVNRFAIYLQPLADFLQLTHRRGTERAIAVWTDTDHEIAALRHCVGEILDDPPAALEMVIGPAIREAAA